MKDIPAIKAVDIKCSNRLSSIAHLKHYDHDGRARFVTFCTNRRLPLLTNNLFRRITHEEIFAFCQASQTHLLAYVIMPEHVHLVLAPPDTLKLGFAIGELKQSIAKRIVPVLQETNSSLLQSLAVERGGEKRLAVWMRRCYDHNCRTENSVWKCVNYCHWNPVKRKLVAAPETWKWSSYKYYLEIPDNLMEIDVSAGSGNFKSSNKK